MAKIFSARDAIQVSGVTRLDALNDVDVGSAVSGALLGFDGTYWVPVPEFVQTDQFSGIMVQTSGGTLYDGIKKLTFLNSVVTTNGIDEAFISGIGDGAGGGFTLGEMSDATITTPVSGQLLVNNGGGQWVNSPNPAYTKAEADAKVTLAIGLHISDVDPHAQYLLQSSATALYQPIGQLIDHNHDNRYDQSGLMLAHVSAGDPHGQYLLESAAPALYAISGNYERSGSVLSHTQAANPHPQYLFSGTHTQEANPHSQYLLSSIAPTLYAPSGNYEISGTANSKLNQHLLDNDPHPLYIIAVVADTRYTLSGNFEISGTVDTRIASHLAAIDPHPQYLTSGEANILYKASGNYDAAGTAFNLLDAHINHSDPHGQYLNQSVASINYAVSGHPDLLLSGHVASSDPHEQYLLESAAPALYAPSGNYEVSGTADVKVAAHAAADNPHPEYLTEDEADALYQVSGNYVSFSGIRSGKTGGTIHQGIMELRFLNSDVINLGGGILEISGGTGGGGGEGAVELNELNDVDFNSVTSGQMLKNNGSHWINEATDYYTRIQSNTNYEASGTLNQHLSSFNHTLFLTESTADPLYAPSGNYEVSGTSDIAISGHLAELDPHPQYLTEDDGDGLYQPIGLYEVSGTSELAFSGHLSDQNPHPQYLTQAEGDTLYNSGITEATAAASYSPLGHTHSTLYEVSGTVLAHEAKQDPHSQYLTEDDADILYQASGVLVGHNHNTAYESSGTMVSHLAAENPHPEYLTEAEADTLYTLSGNFELSGTADLRISEHIAASHPHSQYLREVDADALYQASGVITEHTHSTLYEVSGTVSGHLADEDPHPQYLTELEGNDLYQPSGVTQSHNHDTLYDVSGTMDAHLADMNPHPQYLTEDDSDILYQPSGVTHPHNHDALYEVSGSVESHEGLTNPHPQYLREVDADPLYAPSGNYTLQSSYLITSGVLANSVSFSGIRSGKTGGTIHQGIVELRFLNSDVVNLGGGILEISGGTGGGGGGGGTIELNELNDVDFNSVTSGQMLKHNGSHWINEATDYYTRTQSNTNYEVSGTLVQHLSNFNHTLFLTEATADPLYAPSGNYEVSGTSYIAISGHLAELDPHPQYLTEADSDVLYEVSGTSYLALSGHLADENPHAQYLTQAEGDALYNSGITEATAAATYSPLGHTHAALYEVSGTVLAHEAEDNPHPQYLTEDEADVLYQTSGVLVSHNHDTLYEVSGTVSGHLADINPHPQYLTELEADELYTLSGNFEVSGTADLRLSDHIAASHPHSQYLREVDADALYQASGVVADHTHSALYEVSGTVSGHLADENPHPQYLTELEGDGLYQPSGVTHPHNHDALYEVSGVLEAHEDALDPHPQYLTEDDGDILYQPSGVTHPHNHDILYEVSGSVESHEGLSNPHPQYLREVDADPLYAPSGNYALQSSYLITSGVLANNVPFSGILVGKTGGTIHQGISQIRFLNSDVLNLGGGIVEVSGGTGGVGGGGGATELNELNDVDLNSVVSGNLFIHDGTYWVNEAPKFFTKTESDTRYEVSGTLVQHLSNFNHSLFLTEAVSDTLYTLSGNFEISGTADARIASHLAALDPHPQYLTEDDGDILYQLSGVTPVHNHDTEYEVSGSVASHEAEEDPHPQYLMAGDVIGFSGINVGESESTAYSGINEIRFLNSIVTDLGDGVVEVSGAPGIGTPGIHYEKQAVSMGLDAATGTRSMAISNADVGDATGQNGIRIIRDGFITGWSWQADTMAVGIGNSGWLSITIQKNGAPVLYDNQFFDIGVSTGPGGQFSIDPGIIPVSAGDRIGSRIIYASGLAGTLDDPIVTVEFSQPTSGIIVADGISVSAFTELTDTSGTWTSGQLIQYDGTNFVPIDASQFASSFVIANDLSLVFLEDAGFVIP